MTGLSDRFWSKVEKTETCWNWTGFVMWKGYGTVKIGSNGYRVHRLVYEDLVGPIPDEMTIDHLCCNKLCVNPAHLEVVTRSENTKRARRLVVTCKEGHELYSPPGGRQRYCRVCHTKATRERRAEKRRAASIAI